MPLKLNPITGQLDLVGGGSATDFDSDSILTHEYNSAGSLLKTFDSNSGTQILAGPSVVIDSDGNVVRSN